MILPGFIDGHVHFPQTRVLGAFVEHLLPWLREVDVSGGDQVRPTAPMPAWRRAVLRQSAGLRHDHLPGIYTTAPVATEELFDEAVRRNMRLIAGLTGIDRLASPGYGIDAEEFYRDS